MKWDLSFHSLWMIRSPLAWLLVSIPVYEWIILAILTEAIGAHVLLCSWAIISVFSVEKFLTKLSLVNSVPNNELILNCLNCFQSSVFWKDDLHLSLCTYVFLPLYSWMVKEQLTVRWCYQAQCSGG